MSDAVWFILGIVVSILVDIVVIPRISNWLEQRTLSTRGKTLVRIKTEYERVKLLQNNPNIFSLTMTKAIFRVLAELLLALLGASVALVAYLLKDNDSAFLFFSVVLFCGALLQGWHTYRTLEKSLRDITRIINFDKYEIKILARIKELEQEIQKTR